MLIPSLFECPIQKDRAIISSEQLIIAIGEQGKRPNARLGDILIEAGMITIDQLEEALTIQKTRRIGDILVDMGAVSIRLIQVALSDKLGFRTRTRATVGAPA